MPKKQRGLITDETSVMTRASQREMPRTGKSKPLIHALQLVRELQAKKENAADDRKKSQRELTRGLDSNPRPEPRGAAAGPGRPTLKESDPTHQIPSSTSSFHHSHAIQPRQTCTYKSRKRQVGTTGLPMWFHTRGWFRAGSCKAQENLPIPLSFQKKTRPISNKPMEL